MGKVNVTRMAFLLLLLSCMFSLVSVAKADLVGHRGLVAAYKPYIVFPSNNATYSSNSLTLNVNFHAMAYANMNYSGTYSLDGKPTEVLPLEKHYLGNWVIYHGDNDYVDGSVKLPELSVGTHSITVNLECDWEIADSTGVWTDETVYFTVLSGDNTPPVIILVDKTPPVISNLSVQNRTYNSTDIPLDFNINETTSQISYSLDNNANVTIDGNTTLAGLAEGPHSLTVYANDTAGNMGESETINFNIAREPEPQPKSFPVVSITAPIGIGALLCASLLVYWQKHKR